MQDRWTYITIARSSTLVGQLGYQLGDAFAKSLIGSESPSTNQQKSRQMNKRQLTIRSIEPRLISLSLWEPPTSTPSRNIHNQEKFLIERCGVRDRSVNPRVRKRLRCRAVPPDCREIPSFEEGLVESQVEECV